MKKSFTIYICLAILCLFCGISALQARIVERSSKYIPSWAGKTSEDKQNMYFSGSASDQPTFEAARKLAVSDALTQIVESLDLLMTSSSKKLITNTENYLENKTASRSRNVRVLNTKVSNVYYEKCDNDGETTYNVFVQVEYSKKEYEAEKQRLAKEREVLRQNILNICSKANSLFHNNSHREALKEYFAALKIIYEYGVGREKETEITSKIGELLSEITFNISYMAVDSNNDVTIISDAYFNKTEEPLSNAWFSFKSREMELASLQADEEGGVACNGFGNISFLKKAIYGFELDLKKTYNLDDDICNAYSFRDVSANVDLLGSNKKVLVSLKSDGKVEDIDDFEEAINNELAKNGFTVVKEKSKSKNKGKEQQFDLTLNVKVKFIETVESKLRNIQSTEELFISNAEIKAELILASNNKEIGASSSNIKGFGRSKNKSYNDLMNRVAYFITTSL